MANTIKSSFFYAYTFLSQDSPNSGLWDTLSGPQLVLQQGMKRIVWLLMCPLISDTCYFGHFHWPKQVTKLLLCSVKQGRIILQKKDSTGRGSKYNLLHRTLNKVGYVFLKKMGHLWSHKFEDFCILQSSLELHDLNQYIKGSRKSCNGKKLILFNPIILSFVSTKPFQTPSQHTSTI